MDYHFNLRQGTHKKFRMSPCIHSSGFGRCYSTRSHLHADTNNRMAMAPMLDLLPDCHANQSPFQKTNLLKKSSKISPMNSSMSVSYIVGGFVSSQAKTEPSSSNICKIFDVLVSSFQGRDPGNKKMKDTNKESFPDSYSAVGIKAVTTANISNGAIIQKRTYADVTKGIIPKTNMIQKREINSTQTHNLNSELDIHSNSMFSLCPTDNCFFNNHSFLNQNICSQTFNIKLAPKSCSNISLVNRDQRVKCQSCILPETQKKPNEKNLKKLHEDYGGFLGPVEELIPCASFSHHTFLKSPISPSSECQGINRTLSECSVDSDDSFVVFQNEDDAFNDSLSEEECNSDDSNEVCPHEFTDMVSSLASVPDKKTKKVTFKPDTQLVEVRNMVKWDYAHRAARIGPWEAYGRDRVRFEKRICQASKVLSPILEPSHRSVIFKKRFSENN